jgi:predicted metal-dependent enzyme (double-stranded beta helix superfamily)
MFDQEQFVEDCMAAQAEDSSHKAVREVVVRAVSDPSAVLEGLGEPTEGGFHVIHNTDEMTILNVVWAPNVVLRPHNHNEIWAVIGIYTGREDNVFWRRLPDDADCRIEAAGAVAMSVKDAHPLGPDIIHSVVNPILRLTGAIHVYGGDFFAEGRSEWDPEHLSEYPYDFEAAQKTLEGTG